MTRCAQWMAALAAGATLLTLGCQPQPGATTNAPTNAATANANAAPAAPTKPVADAGGTPVTLPVLDALFAEESFAAEVKSAVGLSDDEVQKLRALAREQTAALRETEGDDDNDTRSTREAARRAEEQVKTAIGEEKTGKLFAFVRERWNGGGAEAGGAAGATAQAGKPGAVPGDTRIVVNAPAYRMDVFEEGKLVKSYKVGIGYPEFPLPTGTRKADTIIFNPTWTPPDEPWVEASNKVKPGETIQGGDKRNPLGPIKIPIGLPSLIHGGKSAAKLGTFASHGCVGLTSPQVQDFASVLGRISGSSDVTAESIKQYAATPTETKNVKLGKTVPVELRYETITVEDGKLHIYRDVYDKNTNTEETLRSVLEAYGVSLDQLSEQERAAALAGVRDMSRDAKGNLDASAPAAANANGNSNANANGNAKPASANANKGAQQSGNNVTTAVKGKKEVVVPVAALAGKGYPAPVELNTGGGSAPAKAPAKKK